ncbi:MAG: hypothetical protein IJ197_10820 [Bacteroidaceae bacterium]|nr:hypothetical protein [Bacteroidaceae bacterium]
MKKTVLLLLLAAFTTVGRADSYFEGVPTIFSDYEGYYRWRLHLNEYEEGTAEYRWAMNDYRNWYHLNRNLCNYWQMLYRTEDGTYFKKRILVEWGDSIVNDISYARVTVNDKDTLLYRQEEKKVLLLSEEGKEILLFDFGLERGDIFTNPQGEKFIVTDKQNTASSEEDENLYATKIWLTSEDGSKEDCWQEGTGSFYWGILPLYIACKLDTFDEEPVWSRPLYIPNIGSCFVEENINEEGYKMNLFPITNYTDVPDLKDNEIRYSFVDDTLLVQGKKTLNYLTSYAECLIAENTIKVNIGQYVYKDLYPTGNVMRYFEARIPGFTPGTYIINGEAVVCGGEDGIRELDNGKWTIDHDGPAYDLSGRRVGDGRRGLKIQGGKKFLVPLR